MPELMEESGGFEDTTIAIQRTSATVKGGRRFSFGALVVVGDRRGRVGFGYEKSPEVPSAIEKAQKRAKKNLIRVPMTGTTLPHEVEGRFGASKVRMIPASPGTGVVAGANVRAVLELAGVTDCLTKCYGSTNALNVLKAVMHGLEQIRVRDEVEQLRGVRLGETDIESKIEHGKKFVTFVPKRQPPAQTEGRRGGRGGRGGGPGGGRRGGPGGRGGRSRPGQQSQGGGGDGGSGEGAS